MVYRMYKYFVAKFHVVLQTELTWEIIEVMHVGLIL